jgi:alpha-tubulin suppressor-like RCC1 family protein
VGGITNWTQVSAGNFHNVGITDSGIAYAWGQGSAGRLGTNNNIPRSSPVTVAGGITNWSQVSAGNTHSLGVTDTGIAYAWGSGNYGLLGTDDTINRSSPVIVAVGITDWSQVSGGSRHSLGVITIAKGFD